MDQHDLNLPDGFTNLVRLFPLPNLVLFPGVVQALHLFEPRYVEMMDNAMASDQLITMALVKPTPQNQVQPVPEVFPTVCIGKVVTQAKLEDGRYNLLLAGVKRAKIVSELSSSTPYRQAKVELIDDFLIDDPSEINSLRERVVNQFRRLTSIQSHIDDETLDQLLEQDVNLSQLVDLICYASGAGPVAQQKVLGISDVAKRCRLVISILERLGESSATSLSNSQENVSHNREFPPGFSLN